MTREGEERKKMASKLRVWESKNHLWRQGCVCVCTHMRAREMCLNFSICIKEGRKIPVLLML